jgi:signal transduction histidine kinase
VITETGEVPSACTAAFRAAPQALLAVDGAGVVRLVSIEAERLLQRAGTQLIGRRLDELLSTDPTGATHAARPAAGPAGETAGTMPVSANRPRPVPLLTASAVRLPDGRQVPVDVRTSYPEAVDAGPADPRGWAVLAVYDPGETVRSRAALEHRVQRLADAEQEQENLMGDLIRAQERERARIAAGVHDDSLQVIAAAMLRLQQLRRRLHDTDALEVLAQLEESIALAADRLRRLIFDFRPPALERSGLAAAVRDALARLRDDAGIEVRLDNQLATEPPLPTRLLLFRIMQEALTNVVKHAVANMVEVTLVGREDGYLVKVADDGVGVAIGKPPYRSAPGHLGLTLMRERAEFAGGWFRIESARAWGTTVSVWVPHGADLEGPPRPPALRGVDVRGRVGP